MTQTSSPPVRWGVLGAANIAVKRVIPAMQAGRNCVVSAIAARDADRAEAAARSCGVERAYGSYEALLVDPLIEAVYVPLPNPLHVDWSIRAMEAGKHVLCEKPIAMNAAEARRLIDARARTGRHIEEGFPFVNHPQWDFIRRTLASGELGAVRAVTGVSAYHNTNPRNLRNQLAQGGGGLYDLGCYLIQATRMAFAGEPERAIGLFDRDPRSGVDRLTSFILGFPDGHANLTAATQAGAVTGGTHQHFGVLCERGWLRAEFPFSHSIPSDCSVFIGDSASRGSIPAREERFAAVNQYQLQAERFSDLVRGAPAAEWPIENAIANMEVIDAVFRSEASKTWERVGR